MNSRTLENAVLHERLLPVLNVLYRWRYFIAGVTILSAIGGYFIPEGYMAETTMVVTYTTLDRDGEGVESLLPEALSPKVYESMALSVDVLGSVLDELTARDAFEDEPPTVSDFGSGLSIEITRVDPTTRPINYAPLLTLRATSDRAELAKAIVDVWSEVLREFSLRVNELRMASAAGEMRNQRERHEAELNDIWTQQSEEEARWDLELLRLELTRRQELISSLESQLVSASTELRAARQRLAATQEKLASEPEIKKLFRSPTDTAYWILKGGEGPAGNLSEIEESGMVTELMNPIYVDLRADADDALQTVASEEARVEHLETQIERLERQQNETRKTLAEHKLVQTRLETNEEYMRKTYLSLAEIEVLLDSSHRLARAAPETGTAPIGLNRLNETTYVDEARGLLSGKARVALTGLIGLLFAVMIVLSYTYILPVWKRLHQ